MEKYRIKHGLYALLLCVTALIICLPTAAWATGGSATPVKGTDYGWIEAEDGSWTYKVVGQYGYDNETFVGYLFSNEQWQKGGYTIDLTEADDFSFEENARVKYFTFQLSGDNVTIKGNPNKPFKNVYFSFRQNIQNYFNPSDGVFNLTLDNYQCDNSNEGSTDNIQDPLHFSGDNFDIEITYSGSVHLPYIRNACNMTLTFKPQDASASSADTLTVQYLHTVYQINTAGGDLDVTKGRTVVFDGGKVVIENGIVAKKITIKNGCQVTGNFAPNDFSTFPKSYSALQALNIEISDNSSVNLTTAPTQAVLIGCNNKGRYYSNQLTTSDPDYFLPTEDSSISIDNSVVNVTYTGDTDSYTESCIGNASAITIKNSTVTVNKSSGTEIKFGAGIGGQFRTLDIEDSTVTASGYMGAGIGWWTGYSGGGGAWPSATATITISGNSVVTADSVYGAGIGNNSDPIGWTGDFKKPATNITISGTSKVKAYSQYGAGIGGGWKNASNTAPVGGAIEIKPDIGGGWGESITVTFPDNDGASASSILSFLENSNSQRSMLDTSEEWFAPTNRSGSAVNSATNIPDSITQNLYVDSGTLNVQDTASVTAESGVCAIAMNTVTTSRTIVQNTMDEAHTSADAVDLNIANGTTTKQLGTLRTGFRSIASTVDNITDDVQLKYGSGDAALTLVNWNEAAGAMYADTFNVTANSFNRFYTMLPYALNGTVTVSLDNSALTANTSNLQPEAARSGLSYQWYKNGAVVEDATNSSLSIESTDSGIYYCVVSTTDSPYYGSVTSEAITVTNGQAATLAAPELESVTSTSIALKQPSDSGTYTYSIDYGGTWQDGLTFTGLDPRTTYYIICKDQDGNISKPLKVTTGNNAPNVYGDPVLVAYDYVAETIKISPSIEVYRDEACTETERVYAGKRIYPGETLYARFAGETDTGNDVVASFRVPDRPAAPSVNVVSQTANSITISTTSGVAYNYAQGDNNPAENAAFIGNGSDHTFTDLNAAVTYTIYTRTPATENAFHSYEGKYTTETRPQAPAADVVTINYADEKLSFDDSYEVSASSEFSTTIKSGESISNIIPANGSEAKTLYVRVKAQGNIPESQSTTFTIPARPAAPTAPTVDYSKEEIATTTDMQYSLDGGESWTNCTANIKLTAFDWDGTADVTVKFRSKAVTEGASKAFASADVDVKIPARDGFNAPTIDYEKETIAIDSSMEYRVGETTTWTSIDNDTPMAVTSFGNWNGDVAVTVHFRKKAVESTSDETGSLASAEATVTIPKRPAAPALSIDNSTEGVTLSDDYYYSFTSDQYNNNDWHQGKDELVKVDPSDSIYIYKAAVTSGQHPDFKSKVETLTAPERASAPTSVPSIDYANESLTGDATGLEYRVGEEGMWTTFTEGTTLASLGWNGSAEMSIYFRTAATGSAYASDPTTTPLRIPARPEKPTPQGVNETVDGRHDGKITGVDATMEYRLSGSEEWIDCLGTEITGLAPGTYQVRVKAETGSSFASEEATIVIATGDHRTYTLTVAAPGFDAVLIGYRQPEAKAITIANSGNSAATITGVSLSGNASAFILSGNDTTVPAGESISSYTIQPVAGLDVGTYTATITVTYDNGVRATAQVSFTVSVPSTPIYRVSIGDLTHGSVSSNHLWATAGTKVTLTIDPDGGYALADLVLRTGDGRTISYVDNGDGTITFTMPGSDVAIEASFAEAEPTPEPGDDWPFVDVSANDWYYDAVAYVFDAGIMGGMSATTFEPQTATTRAMIVSMLHRIENTPAAAAADFSDVAAGDWYAEPVTWAASVGVVGGYPDGSFQPNKQITREELASILYRYAQYKDLDTSARADLSAYTDAPSPWAYDVMAWANAEGLINGRTATTIDAQATLTRAETAAIFQRFLTE